MFSLVLPTHNEADNIKQVIAAIDSVLVGREYEIIVADDDSPDETWRIAQELENPRVKVLRRTENKGLSPAVVDAFAVAQGEYLGVMDADMQHDEMLLPQMLDRLAVVEMVIGSRAVQGGSYGKFTLYRKCTSWVAAILARLILDVTIKDPMAGFFVLRRSVFTRAKPHLCPRGFKILLEIYCCAYPVTYEEIGFYFRTRREGESKLTAGVMGEYLKSLLNLRRTKKKLKSRV